MSCAADRPKDRVAEHLTHRNADTETHGPPVRLLEQ